MDLEEFNEVPDLPNTHILDNRIYTNQEIFKDEQTDIFMNTWLFVCHESELPNAGSFRTTSAGGKPIIIVKGNDGIIRSFYNDHTILAEETGQDTNTSDYLWIIDPLDGTTNFVHGYPSFAISIGLFYRNEPLVAVVVELSLIHI